MEFSTTALSVVMKEEIRQISNSFHSTVILKEDGQVLVHQDSYLDKSGLEIYKNDFFILLKDKDIKFICNGTYFTLIYKNNGDVLCFGANEQGQLVSFHFLNFSFYLQSKRDLDTQINNPFLFC